MRCTYASCPRPYPIHSSAANVLGMSVSTAVVICHTSSRTSFSPSRCCCCRHLGLPWHRCRVLAAHLHMLLLGSAVLALSSARTPRCAASDLQRAPTSFAAHVLTVLDEKQNVLLDTPELISAAARMEAVTGIKSVKLPSKTSNSRLASRSSVRCAHRLGMVGQGDLSS